MINADRNFGFWTTITQLIRWSLAALAWIPCILSGWDNWRDYGICCPISWLIWLAACLIWMYLIFEIFGRWVMDRYTNWLQRKLFEDAFLR